MTSFRNFFVVGNDCTKALAIGGFIGDTLDRRILQSGIVTKDNTISSEQLMQGFKCDLDLTDPTFTDYDNII